MPSSDYTPSLEDVGSILPSRTRAKGGRELGTFTNPSSEGADDGTRPTADQVGKLVTASLAEVQDAIGTQDPPEAVWPAVSGLVALFTAMQVELTYFPEQVGSNKSPYNEYKALYDERLPRLVKAVERAEAGDTGPSSDILPSGNFPDQSGRVIDRRAGSLGSQGDPPWSDFTQTSGDSSDGGMIGFNTKF